MGYFVGIVESTVVIKRENRMMALKAIKALNSNHIRKEWNNYGKPPSKKPKDSNSVSNSPDHSFRGVVWNYDEIVNSLQSFIYMLGFGYVEKENGDLQITEFSGLTCDEKMFFESLAPFVEPNTYMKWFGEDDVQFRWVFDGKTLTVSYLIPSIPK